MHEQQRTTGTIVQFYPDRGFGFIRAAAARRSEVYFHWKDAEPGVTLRRGLVVSYMPTPTAKGARALDVIVEDERATNLPSAK